MLGVVHEVPEDRPVVGSLRVGADVVDLSVAGVGGRPETAARVESFGRIVGGSGGIADSHVDESPVGGGDEAGVRADPSGVAGKGAAGAELGDGLPGANVDGGVVAGGFVAVVGNASGVARGKDEGLMRKDREDGGVVGRNCVEKVNGGVPNGVVPVDVEKLAVGAVEAVERHLVGVDSRPTRTQKGTRCADVGRRRRE